MLFLVSASRAEAFGVQPALQDLLVTPGEVRVERLTVVNTESVDQTVFLSLKAFTEGDSAGAVHFDEETGCSSWFSVPEALRVPATSRAQIPVTMTIPSISNQTPLACQVAVILSRTPTPPNAKKQNVSIDASIASLFFLTLDGTQKEAAVSVMQTIWPPDRLQPFRPLSNVSLILKNTGKTIVLPTITLSVTDLFGRTLWRTELNPQHQRLLVGSARVFSVTPEHVALPTALLGPISWSINVQDQHGQRLVQQHARSWVISYGTLVTLIAAITGALFIWRRYRRSNAVV